eukprot:306428-Chlamydomonas_euryale.AAC.2
MVSLAAILFYPTLENKSGIFSLIYCLKSKYNITITPALVHEFRVVRALGSRVPGVVVGGRLKLSLVAKPQALKVPEGEGRGERQKLRLRLRAVEDEVG